MADVAITAANVKADDHAVRQQGIAGEAVTAGKVGYLDPATKKMRLADSNAVAVVARKGLGIFLNNAAADQPVTLQTGGKIDLGGGLTAGATYFLSDTPGGLCPDADVGAGENVCMMGLAESATVLDLTIRAPGVTR